MPWVKIGRYRFDLNDVALVEDVVGDGASDREHDYDPATAGEGVTVTLHTQLTFNLIGRDAEVFTRTFDEHTAARPIGRPPPKARGGKVSYPRPAAEASPVEM